MSAPLYARFAAADGLRKKPVEGLRPGVHDVDGDRRAELALQGERGVRCRERRQRDDDDVGSAVRLRVRARLIKPAPRIRAVASYPRERDVGAVGERADEPEPERVRRRENRPRRLLRVREVACPERYVVPRLSERLGHKPVALGAEALCREVVERILYPHFHLALLYQIDCIGGLHDWLISRSQHAVREMWYNFPHGEHCQ